MCVPEVVYTYVVWPPACSASPSAAEGGELAFGDCWEKDHRDKFGGGGSEQWEIGVKRCRLKDGVKSLLDESEPAN